MRRSFFMLSACYPAMLCSIAAEGAEEGAGGGAAPADTSGVKDVGGTLRIQPDGDAEGQAAREHQSNLDGGEPVAEEGAGGAAEEGAKKEGEEKPEGAYDFKGTPFEAMTPEFQTAVTPFVQAFDAEGTLTDDQIKAASEATKFPEPMIRQWMEGVQATNAKATEAGAVNAAPVFDAVGGPEQFAEFQKWTAEKDGAGKIVNVTPAEERAFNKLAADDPEAAAAFMAPIVERWKAAGNGGAAADLAGKGAEGGQGGVEGTQPYANWAQAQAAMNNSKYATDAAYREEVYQRMAVSNF